ncbi:uncharacterized protein MELLADRAFT_62306 [Melampsora larici-populina 98AG31]|uniref:Uncharacterized protein n=1 Tax=Melampsora larici-populina (strain 98AG31 / pathotype 3-4-7) TaxID=747676 RepID=F4RIG7_MELLP|nr:uncharacterized protein MELLADRAFT_62306 [Melampsora larici-populina 98AG31]EGG07560.1 hypothetical protein MELLADRAFT_62306 [Melampsora larici-populina 98AG31]
MVTFAQELIESRRLAERALAQGESGPRTRSRSRNQDKDDDNEIEETNRSGEDYEEEDNHDNPEKDFNDEIEYVDDEGEEDPAGTGKKPNGLVGRLREPRDSPEEDDQPKGLPMINVTRDPRQGTTE